MSWSADLLRERDRLGCQQGGGPRGPPFSRAGKFSHLVRRWWPGSWYSIDGTGWCYASEADELMRCADVRGTIDWNGVADADESPDALGAGTLLALAAVAAALAARHAFAQWDRRRRRQERGHQHERQQREGEVAAERVSVVDLVDQVVPGMAGICAAAVNEGGIRGADGSRRRSAWLPLLVEWLRSGEAVPWRWDGGALTALAFGLAGVALAMWTPLPTGGAGSDAGDSGYRYPG